MTLKEMFKKIDNYNEIAEMIHTPRQEVHIRFGFGSKSFDSFKSLKAFLKREYIDEYVEAVLKIDDLTFECENRFEIRDSMGSKWRESIEVYTCDA